MSRRPNSTMGGIFHHRRSKHMTCPFYKTETPSGSDWGIQHLRWLEINFKPQCPMAELLESLRPLKADSPVYQRIRAKLDKEWNEIVKPGANFEGHSFYPKLSKLGESAPISKLEERLARSSSHVYSSSHSSPEQDQTPAHGLNEDLDYGFQYAEDVGTPGLDEEEQEQEQEQEQENEEKEDEAQPRLPPPRSVLLSSNASADTRPQRLSRSAVQRQCYAPTASQGSEQAPGSSDFGSEDAYTKKVHFQTQKTKTNRSYNRLLSLSWTFW